MCGLADRAAALDQSSSAPGGIESLVGAAEAAIRLSATVAQQLRMAAGAAQGTEVAQGVLTALGLSRSCCGRGLQAAADLLYCAFDQLNTANMAAPAGSRAAVLYCAISLAKAARALAALPAEQQAAIEEAADTWLRSSVMAAVGNLAWTTRALCTTPGTELQQR